MMSGELTVAFQSAHEVVIVKPAGVSCELPNDGRGVSIIEQVRRGSIAGVPASAEARLPHRLDRVACGYLVIALTDEGIAHHNAQIAGSAWAKWYLARVACAGDANQLVGEHRAYLRRRGNRAELVRAGGQPARMAILAAEPAPHDARHAHVLIRLHTGRYHQIRAMMAGLGAPLIGDEMYAGPPGRIFLEHAALRFTPTGASTPVTLFDDRSPVREAVNRRVIEALGSALERE